MKRNQYFDPNHSQKVLSCRYNMDTNRAEAQFENGTTLSIDCIFSKAEIWFQELQFNYKFLTNATKQTFSMPTKCRASFSRPLSTLGTANVAKFRPPSVAPWVNVILIKQLLQLYFPKTFQRISFSGYFLAVFDGS